MGDKIRILYIDDYEMDRELVKDALEKEHGGFEVMEASNRVEFETLLRTHRFDVVLSDFNIAGFEGLQVLETVRSIEPHLPVIIVTGTGSEEIAVSALKQGASDYVIKRTTHIRKLPQTILAAIEKESLKEQREQAKAALRESEKKYRLLIENATDAIYIAQDGILKFANPKTEKMTGYNASELAQIPFINIVHPEDRDMVFERHLERLEGKSPPSIYSFRILDKSGKDFMVELNTVLIDWEGRPATLCFLRDITEQKKLESQLRQAQKMEAIGTLSGGIAHDFNNILGIILGNTELAMDDVPQWNPARSNLEEILNACFRAKGVVQQILSYSRQTETEQKPMRIVPILEESLKLLRASIPSSIEIFQDVQTDADTILGNPTQIHQVLINLCTNAAHAMEGGGVLAIRLTDCLLDESGANRYPDVHPGRYVKLSVRDTGCGIAPEMINRVFDPYFTTKDVGKGTGMGLAMVHGIVKSHKGGFSVRSKPGDGSTFDILFPIVDQETIQEARMNEELPRGDENILFVDDEEAMVNINRQRLERLGYQVETRTDPFEALKLFRTYPDLFDLVITDTTMPGMTGDALAREIIKIRPGIPVLLCTGYSDRIDKDGVGKMGIAGFAMKPLGADELARIVRALLDREFRDGGVLES
ncbi:MAG: response regulator [Deltaproteobacteria bacterium]|nr:response regulator [Deltaproteobacteria bacterium]